MHDLDGVYGDGHECAPHDAADDAEEAVDDKYEIAIRGVRLCFHYMSNGINRINYVNVIIVI